MSLLFVFLDGVGLGGDDPAVNPFLVAKTAFLSRYLGGDLTASLKEIKEPEKVFKAIDARLGYEGLPQSATGQTCLLTGTNAAQRMRGHYGPWPGPSLKAELEAGNIFLDVVSQGQRARLFNVYPPGYFQALESGRQKVNVPVYAALHAGLELADINIYRQNKAISVDFTGDYLRRYDASLPTSTAYQSGKCLAALAQEVDFGFFDFWPSDQVGHRGSFAEATSLIESLDQFFEGLITHLEGVSLVVCSDHGNLEDKSHKRHTLANVPLLVVGEKAPYFKGARSILDIAPAIRMSLNLTHL